ncbi:MAG: LytTR family DNA-binding domain-containing protein [Bacteroidia bacterium]|nr:LytTR family DNA-binding domain-containing protein [Bacteroidia bacterium]
MTTYKAVVVDDEENSRKNTIHMLQQYCPEIEVVGEAGSGMEGKKMILEKKPDVVFLDINMPGMSGFEMLEGIYEREFCVIFVTAYSDYGINAVKAGALDYLMKPLILSELQGAVKKVIDYYQKKPKRVPDANNENKNVIVINHNKGFTLLEFKDIIWIEANDNYSNFYLTENRKIMASKTLKEFENILPKNQFFRVHRSALINMQHVKEYIHSEGAVIMSNSEHISVSKNKINEFNDFIKSRSLSPRS